LLGVAADLAEAGPTVRASISRTENLGPVPAAQQGGTVERIALNTLAGRSGTGDSIQRLGGKPLHLKPRGQRPQLHRTQTAPYPYAIRLPHPDSRPPM
jgi:hypothetical protein